jgi:hypothetical protein
MAFQYSRIVWMVLQQSIILGLAFQQATIIMMELRQSMIVGMIFPQARVVGLDVTARYYYRYVLSGGHVRSMLILYSTLFVPCWYCGRTFLFPCSYCRSTLLFPCSYCGPQYTFHVLIFLAHCSFHSCTVLHPARSMILPCPYSAVFLNPVMT